jgi:hypothetical protein
MLAGEPAVWRPARSRLPPDSVRHRLDARSKQRDGELAKGDSFGCGSILGPVVQVVRQDGDGPTDVGRTVGFWGVEG